MKRSTLLFASIVFAIMPFLVQAQSNKNVGIGTNAPNPSAILDISSTDKGILIPRLTATQRMAIQAPVNGLMVYDLDSFCIFYYNDFNWSSLCHPGTASNGIVIGIVNGSQDVQLGSPLTRNTDIPLSGKKLTFSGAGNIGMGNNNPDPSAILDLSNSNNTGMIIPKVALSKTTVTAPVVNPAPALMVYNTATVNDVQPGMYYWDNAKWVRLFATNLPVVSTVSVTAPIVNNGTAADPNIGLTTSDLTGSTVVNVVGGTDKLAGAGVTSVDVVGAQGGILYGTGTSSDFTPAGSGGQYLSSNGTTAPTWNTGKDLNGSTVINVSNGAGQLVGGTNASIDVNGPVGTVLYGTGTSSAFTGQGLNGQVLSSTGAGAPIWINPNAALLSSNLTGSTVVNVVNGTGKVVGAGNAMVDVIGASGGIMYGTGTSSNFTTAGTAGQVLRSTGAGAPVWASPNATLATSDVVTPGGSTVMVTNGTGQVVGGSNMSIDVAGVQGGVMYGTGSSAAFNSAGTAGQYLQSNGTGAPTWATINTTTSDLVSPGGSTVVVTNGTNKVFGAGNASVDVVGTNGGMLYGTGTSSAFTAVGTAGQVMTSNGAAAPTWQAPATVTASNGLTKVASDIQLGGTLTTATIITQASNSLSIAGGTINMNNNSNNPINIATGTSTGAVFIANGASGGAVSIGRNNTITASTGSQVGINKPAPNQALDVVGNVQFSQALMPNADPGTSGQYLKSQGASTAPVWVNPKVKYDVKGPAVGVAAAVGAYYMGLNNFNASYNTTTPTSILYYYACVGYSIGYYPTTACVLSGAQGSVSSVTAGRVVTVSVYKYPVIDGSVANLVGTLLSSTSVTCTVANANYKFTVPASATTVNPGDLVILYYSINAAGTIFCNSDMEFTNSLN